MAETPYPNRGPPTSPPAPPSAAHTPLRRETPSKLARPAKTDTFLGARYRRLVQSVASNVALVAVARSILVIVWRLLNDPDARYHDLI